MTDDSADSPPVVELRPTCLILLPGLTWDEWLGAWQSLDQTNRSLPWLTGDALLYSQQNFGEQWSQAVDAQYAEQYIRYLRVSTLIPPAERRENFSWSAHRELAALAPAERAEILDLAEAQGWRSREIRDEVQRRKALRKGNGGPPLDEPPLPLEQEQNSTWNGPDDGDTFGSVEDVEGEPTWTEEGIARADAIAAGLIERLAPTRPNGISAPPQCDRADDIRAIIAAVRRLAPDLSDAWRMENFRIEGRESTVKLVRGDQLAVGIGPSLPCALVEAALSALLSDLGAG